MNAAARILPQNGGRNLQRQKDSFNSTAAQRARLLENLQLAGSITTLQARAQLDVLHPAMRVLELRKQGHRITTHWTTENTDCGQAHRVALYVLEPEVPR